MKFINRIASAADHAYARAGVAASLALASVGASAQTTDPFDTVMTDITTKVTEYAGALVVLAGVSVVFMVGMKYVKKIRGAA